MLGRKGVDIMSDKEKEFYQLLAKMNEEFGVGTIEEIEKDIKEHPIEIGVFTLS